MNSQFFVNNKNIDIKKVNNFFENSFEINKSNKIMNDKVIKICTPNL